MKPWHPCALSLVALLSPLARAAAFQNLDFEAAHIVSPPSDQFGDALVSEALPGWSVDWTPMGGDVGYGQNAQLVRYNRVFLSGPTTLLVGPERDDYPSVGPVPLPISGNYSAGGTFLQLSQRGDIPAGRTGLVFETNFMPPSDWPSSFYWLHVSIDGSLLPVTPTGILGQFRADISPWAGREVILAFSTGENLSVIDNISIVPEPTAWAFASGIPLVAWGVLRGRRRGISPA